MHASRRMAALVVVAALALVGCSDGTPQGAGPSLVACGGGAPGPAPSGPDALPVVELTALGGASSESTACWTGQPLVINFWAEWCAPCKAEMPDFEQVHQALGDQVRFIGVDYQDRAQAAIEFAEQVGVTYDLVEDPDGDFFDAVQGRGTPQTLLVDAEGTIVHRHAGPLTREALEDLLASELHVAS